VGQQVALGLGQLRPRHRFHRRGGGLAGHRRLADLVADDVLADAGAQRQAIGELIAGGGFRNRRGDGQHRVQKGEPASRRRRVVLNDGRIDQEVEIRAAPRSTSAW
jgi:hypothetical protein